jgi:hypothetical protein
VGEVSKERLEEIRNYQNPQELIDVFRHGSKEECSAACSAFAGLPHSKYNALLKAFKDTSSVKVRKWAIIAMGMSYDGLFLKQIVEMLGDRSAQVRETAYKVLRDTVNGEKLLELISEEQGMTKKKTRSSRLNAYATRLAEDIQLGKLGIGAEELGRIRQGGLLFRPKLPSPSTPPLKPVSKISA